MNEKQFVGYEYHSVTAKNKLEAVYADGYENFGWALEGREHTLAGIDSVTMKFKRDRKTPNKAELTRLQRNFEANVKEIEALEQAKSTSAFAWAVIVGIIGCAFLAGAMFAFLANLIPLMVILAVPGFGGWILPYFLFISIRKKRTEEMIPLIDGKFDEIYQICEKANGLLA